jgi:hypothetical protein
MRIDRARPFPVVLGDAAADAGTAADADEFEASPLASECGADEDAGGGAGGLSRPLEDAERKGERMGAWYASVIVCCLAALAAPVAVRVARLAAAEPPPKRCGDWVRIGPQGDTACCCCCPDRRPLICVHGRVARGRVTRGGTRHTGSTGSTEPNGRRARLGRCGGSVQSSENKTFA